MSLYKYEEAIVAKMREITGDDRVIITPSDNVENVIPRIANDEYKLPLIHIVRNDWGLSTKRQHGMKMNGLINDNLPMFQEGNYISPEDGKVHRFHVLPIHFSHTFEVWTRTREENDEMIRELIWFFSTMNRLYVQIPYGVNITHEFTLTLQPDITDSTNQTSHKELGELFKQSLTTVCDDAYLWKSSTHNPTCIHMDMELKTPRQRLINEMNYNALTAEAQARGDEV